MSVFQICVPRLGMVEDSLFTEKDFLNHVLIPDSDHVYNTLSNKVRGGGGVNNLKLLTL